MAKKYKKYIRGTVNEVMDLGTLAAVTAISQDFDESVEEKAWISSIVAAWALHRFTEATDDGPILVGLAHSDYTTAEIEAWIENSTSWKEGDKVGQELGRRKIVKVGIFQTEGSGAETDIMTLQDGKMIRTKLGWMLTTGQTVKQWAYNMGASPLATSDPRSFLEGYANLWPA